MLDLRDWLWLLLAAALTGGAGWWADKAHIAAWPALWGALGVLVGGGLAAWLAGRGEWEEEEEEEEAPAEGMRSVYVGNLPGWPAGRLRDELTRKFSAYGEVKRVRLIKDKQTGRLRGFAFVDMDAQGAGKALAEAKGMKLGGRALKIRPAARDPY